MLSPGDFSVVVRALETVNDGRSLNVPRVLVNNNQQASLNSVLQQPFVSINAFDTIPTTSFGGRLEASLDYGTRTIKAQLVGFLRARFVFFVSFVVNVAVYSTARAERRSGRVRHVDERLQRGTCFAGGDRVARHFHANGKFRREVSHDQRRRCVEHGHFRVRPRPA